MSRSSSTLYRPTTKYKRRRHPTPMTKQQVKQGISDGTIPSAISDTGATRQQEHSMIHSTPLQNLPPRFSSCPQVALHRLHISPNSCSMSVPLLTKLTLFPISHRLYSAAASLPTLGTLPCTTRMKSTSTTPTKSTSTPPPSSRMSTHGLWRVPLRQITCNINNDTLILDSPCVRRAIHRRNPRLLASSSTREQHSILNVYELPSIQQTIRYLHAAAGFPTKTTWMAAIRRGNYDTWPLVTVANIHKHFPQSEETQQGHMRSQRQGVRSTKTTRHAPPTTPTHTAPSLPHHNIFVKTYDTRDTVYSDQTGQFPHVSSRGYRYQMILYHTDSNSIWVEPTKNRTEGELILARTRALSPVCEHVDSHQSAKSSTMKHPQHTSKPS
eukprot:CCRYP_015312-RA/>CCRYP_015312-RA protein AED:0.46 eAED:0.67 QI:0/0/0/1/0.5/0.33/3/0/382